MSMPFQRYRTWVEIKESALRGNAYALRRLLASGVQAMAVVKSNAYGHGLTAAARILEDAGMDWFGVDSFGEAEALRREGLSKPILILGYTLHDMLPEVVYLGARQVVYDHAALSALAEAAERLKKPALIHLKIETGTARQGLHSSALPEFLAHIRREHPYVRLEGAYTHFADVEDVPRGDTVSADPYWRTQLARFEEALNHISGSGYHTKVVRHAAASAAALLYPETHFDLVRLGIAVYGLWPSVEIREAMSRAAFPVALEPVLSWKTRVAQVKRVAKGEPVGYGLSERLLRDSKIAVLPVGYWDGYDRGLSGIGEVLIRGKRARVLGRVCMNMIMVDVTDIEGAGHEDEVMLIGQEGSERVTADELAEKLGTINYEIVTRINPLIPRIIV